MKQANRRDGARVLGWPFWLALGWLGLIGGAALLAPWLANDRPILVIHDGEVLWPDLSIPQDGVPRKSEYGYDRAYDMAWWPLVPFSPLKDYKRALPPGSVADKTGKHAFVHLLGTTNGRQDVLAAIIHGARTSLFMGLLGTLLTSVIGLIIGAIAGYWGNHSRSWTLAQWVAILIGLPLAYFYGFEVRSLAFAQAAEEGVWSWFWQVIIGLSIAGGMLWGIAKLAKKLPWGNHRSIYIPIDTLLLKWIEIVSALPVLLLLIILAAVFRNNDRDLILLLIGLTSWPGMALLVRGQVLRERALPYVEAAQSLGLPRWRVAIFHLLPNISGPILALMALMVGNIILVEATLSFLALLKGEVSWGSLVQDAPQHYDLWWQYVWPLGCLFLTIFATQIIAENLRKRYDVTHNWLTQAAKPTSDPSKMNVGKT